MLNTVFLYKKATKKLQLSKSSYSIVIYIQSHKHIKCININITNATAFCPFPIFYQSPDSLAVVMPTLKASQRYRLTQRISASYVLAYLRHGCDSKIYCLFIVITIGIQPLGSIQLQGNKTLDCVCRFLVTSCDGDTNSVYYGILFTSLGSDPQYISSKPQTSRRDRLFVLYDADVTTFIKQLQLRRGITSLRVFNNSAKVVRPYSLLTLRTLKL